MSAYPTNLPDGWHDSDYGDGKFLVRSGLVLGAYNPDDGAYRVGYWQGDTLKQTRARSVQAAREIVEKGVEGELSNAS